MGRADWRRFLFAGIAGGLNHRTESPTCIRRGRRERGDRERE
jgi:hypothetical protein